MTTIAIQAAATAAFGPLGPVATAGLTALGAVLDSQVVIPAIFPAPDIHGPRIGDLKIQHTTEGSPVNLVFGPKKRVGGTVLWLSDLIEQKQTSHGGGKGGSGGDFVQYQYFVHAAISVCKGPIKRVRKVWADGKLLFDDEGLDINLTSNTISATAVEITPPGGNPIYYCDLRSSSVSFEGFQTGKDVYVAGFTNGTLNGTFMCEYTKTGGATDIIRLRRTSAAVNESAGASVNLYQELPTFSPKQLTGMRFYRGFKEQEPSSLIESIEGEGKVPGYTGLAYWVVERFNLLDYGNRLPNMEFLVEQTDSITAGEVCGELFQLADLSRSEYDVDDFTQSVEGFGVPGDQNIKGMIQMFLLAYTGIAFQENNKIKVKDRSAVEGPFNIPVNRIVAHEPGTDPPYPSMRTIESVHKIPSIIRVQYDDKDKDYQTGSQVYRVPGGSGNVTERINLPVVLTPNQAVRIAARYAHHNFISAHHHEIQLPPTRMNIRIGDLVSFDAGGDTAQILVDQIDRGHDWVMYVSGKEEDTGVINGLSWVEGETPQSNSTASGTQFHVHAPPPAMQGFILDIAALRDDHLHQPGYYAAVACADEKVNFTGCELWESRDGGTTYTYVTRLTEEAVMGYLTQAPPFTVAKTPFVVDRTNTIRIEFFKDFFSHSSVAEELMLDGFNRGILGPGEIIGWANSTLISGTEWELDTLLRGLRDTSEHMGAHATGDAFVLLDGPGLVWIPHSVSSVGMVRKFKFVPVGGNLADAAEISVTLNGQNLRPFSVENLELTRDGSDDVSGTWDRRTRQVIKPLAGNAPLAEETEQYEVDFKDGATIRRTKVVTSPSVSYTAAERVTDGWDATDPVTFEVYQISAAVGRGKITSGTI